MTQTNEQVSAETGTDIVDELPGIKIQPVEKEIRREIQALYNDIQREFMRDTEKGVSVSKAFFHKARDSVSVAEIDRTCRQLI